MDDDTASLGEAGARAWRDSIITRMFRVMHVFEQDNFDAKRYGSQHANMFFADQHAAFFAFLLDNLDGFYRARQLLAEDASRALYDDLVLFRTMSHLHVRLPFNTPEHRQQAATADRYRIIDTEDRGLLGALSIFLIPDGSNDIRVKCWNENVQATWLQRQYYLQRGNMQVMPSAGDHVIDAGGCFGDTALAFASAVGASGHVYTFDPLPQHCAIIRQNLEMNPSLASRISVYEVGLSATERIGCGFGDRAEAINPGATAFDDAISTTTLDRLVTDHKIPGVDFIKMDIEGSELDALKGSEGVLRAHRPRLAISLYHRPEDLFAIPLWIDKLGCGYRFYLDHYSIHREETVLYAAAS